MSENAELQVVLDGALAAMDRLCQERDAARNALHGMRRRVASLTDELILVRRELEATHKRLRQSDDWNLGLLEDHWDAKRDRALEEE